MTQRITSTRPGALFGLGFTAVLLAAAGYSIFFLAPEERTMRAIQRIFYFHVTSAWTSFVAFFIVCVAGIRYLVRRRPQDDWLAISSAEVGLAFTSVVLVTGPIWAQPVWGIWWPWDARLTSTFVLWLLFLAYLILRTLVDDPERRAVVSAVYGIFAFLDVPLVYMSIRWWRTQHPQPVIVGGAGSGLEPTMRKVFWFWFLNLVILMIFLIRERYTLEAMREEVHTLEREAEAA